MFLRSPFVKRSMLTILVCVSLFTIAARPLQAPASDVSVLVQLALAAFTALVGWPALLSVVVTALQYWGWLGVSASETFMFWANVVVFGGIFVLALLGKIDLVSKVDSTFGNLAQLVTYILIILGVPIGFQRARTANDHFRATFMFQRGAMARGLTK